jgi:hypothetical protein
LASKKRKGAKLGAKVGARVAPKAGKVAGKTAWKLGKAEAKLARRAMSSREPKAARFVKYGFFALAGLAVGALISRSGRNGSASGETWGGPYQRPEDSNRTGAGREYSDPGSGPLIGEDPRTMDLPRVNVEVNDGIAELRGTAPSEEAKAAVGEIASSTEGVSEVRNLLIIAVG